ncbi:L,D-transpeptidase family protein [Streptomyces sp. NPDC051776]|uniref:L,D-transpeptidase family protein n=1 Tax=Streptomyces sp. NPDC051776 TaxID=3155414 RepID=UPI0034273D1C
MRMGAVVRRALAASAVTALAAGLTSGCRYEPPRGTGPARTAPGAGHADSRPARAALHAKSANPGASAQPGKGARPAKPAAGPAAPAPVRPLLMASGSRSGQVRELQARLRELGLFDRNPTGFYGSVTTASVTSFQARRGLARTGAVDIATWSALRSVTAPPSRTALFPTTSKPLGRPDPRCLTGRVLCISKSSDTLAWMIDGRVVSAMDVRFGSQYTPTREGSFTVYFKSRDHVSTIYKTAMPYALFFSGGQAVHYSADFAARGYRGASHGCVNVRDKAGIAALFDRTRTGDKVVIYR